MEPGTTEDRSAQVRTLSQLRRGTLPYCVLASLEQHERYGFDLVRVLTETHGLAVSEGTIYPLLSRLRRDGLVTTTWRDSQNGPPRRYYRLTLAGSRALDSFRAEWRAFRATVDALLEPGTRDGAVPCPPSGGTDHERDDAPA